MNKVQLKELVIHQTLFHMLSTDQCITSWEYKAFLPLLKNSVSHEGERQTFLTLGVEWNSLQSTEAQRKKCFFMGTAAKQGVRIV